MCMFLILFVVVFYLVNYESFEIIWYLKYILWYYNGNENINLVLILIKFCL